MIVLILCVGCTRDSEPECLADCASAIVLTVRGNASAGSPQASLAGAEGHCITETTQANTAICFLGNQPGVYRFDVVAPGYRSQRVDITVSASDAVCGCGYFTEERELILELL